MNRNNINKNGDGALSARSLFSNNNLAMFANIKQNVEQFDYDYRGLMHRYRKGEVFASDTCDIAQMLLTDVEWQYHYSPFGYHTSTLLSAGGVRKYDYEIGRFTSVDPLFEKYYGWSPYQYCGNNLVNLVDRNGKKIIFPQQDQHYINIFNTNLNYLKSLNSPTVNAILYEAEGTNTKQFVYFFSEQRPIDGITESQLFSRTVEEIWNFNKDGSLNQSIFFTKPSKNIGNAEIFLSSEGLQGNMIEGKLGPYAISPLIILDELHHGISKFRGIDKEKNDHKILFRNLKNEIDKGILQVPETIIYQIDEKIK